MLEFINDTGDVCNISQVKSSMRVTLQLKTNCID